MSVVLSVTSCPHFGNKQFEQLNNSVLMIERHYSKLTATMAAEQLA
jgi:hypothetical protein